MLDAPSSQSTAAPVSGPIDAVAGPGASSGATAYMRNAWKAFSSDPRVQTVGKGAVGAAKLVDAYATSINPMTATKYAVAPIAGMISGGPPENQNAIPATDRPMDPNVTANPAKFGTQLQGVDQTQADAARNAPLPSAFMQGPQMVGATNVDLVDPRFQKQQQDAIKAQQAGIDAESNAAGDEAQAIAGQELVKAGGLNSMGQTRAQYAEGMESRAGEREAKLAQLAQHIDAQSAAVQAMNKVDPTRFWKNQSTAQKIGYSVATFLGDIGSAVPHRNGNSVLDMIQKHVDEDIDAQRENYQHGRDRLTDMNNLYTRAYQATGDHEAATRLATSWGLDAAQNMVDAAATSNGSQIAIAKGDALKAQLQQKRAVIEQHGVDEAIKAHKYIPAHLAGPAPGAAGASVVDWKAREKLENERLDHGLPAFGARYDRLRQLQQANGGVIPGTSYKDRVLLSLAHGDGATAALARSQLSPEALETDSLLTGIAEGVAKANGQRGPEAVQMNKQMLLGNGSHEVLSRNLADAANVIGAEERSIAAMAPTQQSQVGQISRDVAPLPRELAPRIMSNAAPRSAPTPDGFEENK